MALSGFNQEDGTVTGNVQNLTIESKQNTSTTKGSTIGESLSIALNGMPNSISANYSQTNEERKDDIYKEIIANSRHSRDAVNKSLGVK